MSLRTIFAVLALVTLTGCAAESADADEASDPAGAAQHDEKPGSPAVEDSAPAPPRTIEWHMIRPEPHPSSDCSEQGAGSC